MLAKLRIRHLLPATYLLIALVSGAFALLGWYVSEQVRRSVDELVTRDIAVQQAAADLSDAVGTVSTSLAGVMTRVRSPMGGFSETTVAFNIIETRVALLRELIGARSGAAPHALLDELDRHVAGAIAVKDGVRAALADPDVDLYGALRRWTEAVEPIEATLRELRAIFAANMTAGKLAAERWSQLGYWIAAIALVASVGVGAGGTVFVIRHVAQPLDWGTRILRKLASGRRDLEIAIPDRHDEIGDLFAAFASYQDSLREGERLSAEAAEQRQRLDTALNNMSHGLAMFDAAGGLILCNAVYARMYALPPELAVPGTALERIVAHRVEQGCGPVDADDFQRRHVTRAVAGKASQYTLDLQDGRVVRVAHQPMEGGGWVAMHEDITEAVRAEARISHMARHDALTDLPNRVQFRDRLAEGLRRLPRDEAIAVHCLDLDRFKSVNDSLGHPVGDALLGQVAERLKDCVAPGDTVARLGGDEFAIVQVGLLQPTGATALAQRVVDALAAPFDVLGHQIVMGTSVGIAVAPHDGADPDHLLKNADLALYRAKAEAKGSYRFFESDMDAAMQTRRALEVDLRLGLARGEFALHYQPLVNLRSGRVSGCEALVRWHHPERGLVSPAEFIPLAEEIGLIVPLGEWILRQACLDAAGWPEPITVAVNLSPVQFRGRSLVAGVFAALSASHLPASRLELEITEAVMLDDTETTLATLHQLRALGVRIAMDDFGTGYSSLSYLRRFPFDKIKIDRSFVRDLPERSDSVAIVRAVTGLGQSLGIHTTAEGVETPEQLAALQREGCDEVQGFLFSKPVPGADFVKLLARGDFARVA